MILNLKISDDQIASVQPLLDQFHAQLEDREQLWAPDLTLAIQLSEQLQDILLGQKEAIAQIWQDSRTQARTLYLYHPIGDVLNWPWELATLDRPLLALARLFQPIALPFTPSDSYPLKVLIMVSAPEGATRLDYEKEELKLLQAFAPLLEKGLVQIHFTDDGSLDNLKEKLQANKYHILHYSGHGTYHEGIGFLAMEEPLTGREQMVTGLELMQVLGEMKTKQHCPDLVVLSACKSAQGDVNNDVSGVAETLLHGGIPAVIAMAASILDSSAIVFAAALYQQLAQKFPLGRAFHQALQAVREQETNDPQLQRSKTGKFPAQWLIPQLRLHDSVDALMAPNATREELDFSHSTQILTGSKHLVKLRVRPENYVFIGRRRDKRTALQFLLNKQPVLLRGQGGVGKTALSEHLCIRLLAQDARYHVFVLQETEGKAQVLLEAMKDYLRLKMPLMDFVQFEQILTAQPALTNQFRLLLTAVQHICTPIFLIDNVETYQYLDQNPPTWKVDEYGDILAILQLLVQSQPGPVTLTGRYPVPELGPIKECDLNTVPFGDFLQKCYQLPFYQQSQHQQGDPLSQIPIRRAQPQRPFTFKELAHALYELMGGNYRALEFFSELFCAAPEGAFQTIVDLQDFKQRLSQQQILAGVHVQMSQNLFVQELLGLLDETARDTLTVLAQFRIPVFPAALGMQRDYADRTESLSQLVSLTLVEKRTGGDGRERYYVVPLVREVIGGLLGEIEDFDHEGAGDYYREGVMEYLAENPLIELQEAFEHYALAESVDGVNEMGNVLVSYFYRVQQYQIALAYGNRVESIAKDSTLNAIKGNLGVIHYTFGNLDRALIYYEDCLERSQKSKNLYWEGTVLNNISQIHDSKGDYDKALIYLQRSLPIRRTIGDRNGEATTLNNMGAIAYGKKDYEQALDFFQQSLSIQKDLENLDGVAISLGNMGKIYMSQENYIEAQKYFLEVLSISQKTGNRKNEALALNNLSTMYHALRDFQQALVYLHIALPIQQELGDRYGEANTLNNIGAIYVEQNQLEAAIPPLWSAYLIFQKMGVPDKKNPEDYLAVIISKIGEARFKEILAELIQNT